MRSSTRLALLKGLPVIALVLVALSGTPTAAQTCPGDCDSNRTVTIDEAIRGVRIALGELALSVCDVLDTSGDGSVAIDELVAAVNAVLHGCPPTPTPTTTPTPTFTPTPTHTPTPTSTSTPTPTHTPTPTPTRTPTPTPTDTPTPTPTSPPPKLEIVANPDPVRPGDVLSIEIVASNPNPFDLLDVSIEAEVPNDVDNFSSLLAGAATCVGGNTAASCEPNDRLIWNLGTVPARQGVTVSVAPRVRSGGAAPADGTPIGVEATLLVGGQQRAHDASDVLVDAVMPLELALREDADPVAPGALLTYTLAFGNTSSNVLAPDAVLGMPLPSGTTLVAASDGGMLDAGVVEWALGTLAPGEGGTRQLTVRVDAGVALGTIISAGADIADTNTPADRKHAGTATRVTIQGSLRLAMEVNPDPANPGDGLAVQLTATNAGVAPLTDVAVELILPEGLVNFSPALNDGGTCPNSVFSAALCEARERVVWQLGTLAPGSGITVTTQPLVADSAVSGIVLVFDAYASENTGQQVATSRTVVVESGTVLELTLRDDVDPVAPGAVLAYTLAFGNRSSNVLAPGAVLRMALPPGTELVAASDDGTLDGDVVEWTIGTLAPGDGGTRQLTVEVPAETALGATISAAAEIGDTNTPPNRTRAGAVTRVAAQRALRLAMEVNPDPANPGDGLAIQLTATNAGTAPLTNVAVELLLPEGLANFSPSLNDGGTCPNSVFSAALCEPREHVVWQLGTLAPGTGVTVTTQPLVADTTASGSVLAFDAEATENTGLRLATSLTVVVESGTVLELALRDDVDPAPPGAILTYTLAFGNRSTNVLAPGAVLRMPLPPGTELVSAGDGGVLDGDVVEWTLGTLAPGDGGTRQLAVEVLAETTPGATISAAAEIADTNTPPNRTRAGAVTRVAVQGSLRLALEVNPDPANPGDGLAVRLTASNAGAAPLTDVAVELLLPEGLANFAPLLNDDGTCPNSVFSAALCEPREHVVWQLGTLAPGTGITVTTQPLVADTTESGSVLVFDAAATEAAGQRVATARTVVVESGTVLELVLREDVDPVAPGAALTYTLAFGNRSNNVLAPDAVLRMPLPQGTAFVAASDGGVLVGDVVEWMLGALPPGEGGTRLLQVEADESATLGSAIIAAADIADAGTPPNRTRARAVTRVAAAGSLHLALEVNPDPADPGDGLAVQLTATNTAAVPLLDVAVELLLPQGIDSFSPALNDGGTCPNSVFSAALCEARERVVWQLGTLAPGAGIKVTTQPLVSDTTASGSVLVFDAQALDTTGQRVAAARTIVVESGTVLELALREDMDPVAAGADLTYTLAFGNRSSNVLAADATLHMPLPQGTTFVAASDGGMLVLVDEAVEWALGSLAPGAGGTRQVMVEVEPGTTQGDLIVAAAEIADSGAPANRTRATTVARVAPSGALRLAVEVTPQAGSPSGSFEVDLTVTNAGGVPLFDVEVELILPDGLGSFSPVVNNGGVCPNSVFSAALCEPRERVVWQVGMLGAGAEVILTTDPPIPNGALPGTVVTFDGRATSTGGSFVNAEAVVRVGP